MPPGSPSRASWRGVVRRRARSEVEAIALAAMRERWAAAGGGADLDRLAAAVADGESDPYAAADELVDGVS